MWCARADQLWSDHSLDFEPGVCVCVLLLPLGQFSLPRLLPGLLSAQIGAGSPGTLSKAPALWKQDLLSSIYASFLSVI